MEQNKFYSINKAAEVFEVEPVFILRSIKKGKLPAHRRGGRYLINWYDLVDYRRNFEEDFLAHSVAEDSEIFSGAHT